jgi:chaperonin GroEL
MVLMAKSAAEFRDEFENMGAQLVKSVASKTADVARDRATTATVLAHAVFREGAKAVAAGLNPMDLKRGIDLAVEAVVADIQKRSKKVANSRILSGSAPSLPMVIPISVACWRRPWKRFGNEGVIAIEEAKSLVTELDVVEGMQFDRGFLSPISSPTPKKCCVSWKIPLS